MCFERHRAQGLYNQFLANVCESIKICNGCRRLCYIRPLCRKASVENPGEDTSTIASREENPQINTNDVEDTVECVKRDRIAFVFYF